MSEDDKTMADALQASDEQAAERVARAVKAEHLTPEQRAAAASFRMSPEEWAAWQLRDPTEREAALALRRDKASDDSRPDPELARRVRERLGR